MVLKILKTLLKILLITVSLLIFASYLIFLLKPFCLKLGYTLCAAIGEDFFCLYQATYNFFHNYFIYGDLAKINLVTPYFVIFRFFPVSPLLIGWPFVIFIFVILLLRTDKKQFLAIFINNRKSLAANINL